MPWTFYSSNGEALVQHAESEATQAEMEAETAGAKFVPPDLVKHSPGVAKAWVEFQIDGNRLSSYNIASVTDDAAGYWSPQIATDFAAVNYAAFCTIQSNDITTSGIIGELSADSGIKAVGSLRVRAIDDSGGVADPTGSDPSISVVLFGDQ
jgi:hypothetical protein